MNITQRLFVLTVLFLVSIFIEANAVVSNVALNKPTSQSSNEYVGDIGTSDKAVDGNTAGDWHYGFPTYTKNENQPWWRVDLGGPHDISNVVIWNQTLHSIHWLSNFRVEYLDASDNILHTSEIGPWPNPSVSIEHTQNDVYAIRVALNGTNHLSIAEVQVFGQPSPAEFAEVYQAEDYTDANNVVIASDQESFTGTGFVKLGETGSWLEWNNVYTASGGEFNLAFSFDTTYRRYADLYVNGIRVKQLVFEADFLSTWYTLTTTVSLQPGNNTIRLTPVRLAAGQTAPNIDYMLTYPASVERDEETLHQYIFARTQTRLALQAALAKGFALLDNGAEYGVLHSGRPGHRTLNMLSGELLLGNPADLFFMNGARIGAATGTSLPFGSTPVESVQNLQEFSEASVNVSETSGITNYLNLFKNPGSAGPAFEAFVGAVLVILDGVLDIIEINQIIELTRLKEDVNEWAETFPPINGTAKERSDWFREGLVVMKILTESQDQAFEHLLEYLAREYGILVYPENVRSQIMAKVIELMLSDETYQSIIEPGKNSRVGFWDNLNDPIGVTGNAEMLADIIVQILNDTHPEVPHLAKEPNELRDCVRLEWDDYNNTVRYISTSCSETARSLCEYVTVPSDTNQDVSRTHYYVTERTDEIENADSACMSEDQMLLEGANLSSGIGHWPDISTTDFDEVKVKEVMVEAGLYTVATSGTACSTSNGCSSGVTSVSRARRSHQSSHIVTGQARVNRGRQREVTLMAHNLQTEMTRQTSSYNRLLVHAFPVGQGSCHLAQCLVTDPTGTVVQTYNTLFDCGTKGSLGNGPAWPFAMSSNLNRRITGALMRATGISDDNELDLVVSHSDSDHSSFIKYLFSTTGNPMFGLMPNEIHFGGDIGNFPAAFKTWLANVINNSEGGIEINDVMTFAPIVDNQNRWFNPGQPISLRHNAFAQCGAHLEYNSVNVGIGTDFNPSPDGEEKNKVSAVLSLEHKTDDYGYYALLPGDATQDTLYDIIPKIGTRYPMLQNYDSRLIMVPHHGADTHGSNDLGFIDWYNPTHAIYSASRHQGFRHPRITTINNYLIPNSLLNIPGVVPAHSIWSWSENHNDWIDYPLGNIAQWSTYNSGYIYSELLIPHDPEENPYIHNVKAMKALMPFPHTISSQ